MSRAPALARTGSAVLALTLAVASLALGLAATPASAAPLPPEITSPTEGSYVAPADLITITPATAAARAGSPRR